jgi:hypothetical protein
LEREGPAGNGGAFYVVVIVQQLFENALSNLFQSLKKASPFGRGLLAKFIPAVGHRTP